MDNASSHYRSRKSVFTKNLLILLSIFGVCLAVLNIRFAGLLDDVHLSSSVVDLHLKDSLAFSSLNRNIGIDSSEQKANALEQNHRLAGLNCDKWGGPSRDAAAEMVYWEDIPSDESHVSPFHNASGPTQYLTFEPDEGGWNNIRMAMETILTTSFAMGRTLVLPPHQRMYLLNKKDKNQRDAFSFEHFFHMERISQEHVGFNFISMDEFLQLFIDGRLIGRSGQVVFPPGNRTDWNGARAYEIEILHNWLREEASQVLQWDPNECMAAFPKSNSEKSLQELIAIHEKMRKDGYPNWEDYVGNPVGVDAKPRERLKENWAGRSGLCLYNTTLQQAPWVHFPVAHGGRYKSHWRMDLWTKRFVRDHVRYVDEIQCAAARVVHAIREKYHSPVFDSLHVRRGDFQYKGTRVSIEKLYSMLSKQIPENATLFIATDEHDKTYFDMLKDHYRILFLDDFVEELGGDVNTNYYGMIDQLVASRGRIFYGCWFSTFTGYINRLRGYHSDNHQTPGYEMGIIPSYYYAMPDRYMDMQQYVPVKRSFYAREFPTSWTLIDSGVVVETT
eukprot:scaffold781_cov132-Cylindrotheca_fusiformis.AAC.3